MMKTSETGRSHRKRELTRHELDLWIHATRDVRRNQHSPRQSDPPSQALTTAVAAPPIAPIAVAAQRPSNARAPTPPAIALPPLTGVEPKVRRRLARGQISVEAALDLHGLRQDEAHRAVHGFLEQAFFSGVRLVLIVTGKGGAPGSDDPYQRAGVLRQMVPHWLREASMRKIVIGFEEASPSKGGRGALYVRIRRSERGHPMRADR